MPKETRPSGSEPGVLSALVGLGNPGAEYQDTRHNAGFWLLDAWCEQHRSALSGVSWTDNKSCIYCKVRHGGTELLLVKPLRFMNRSGEAVLPILRFYKIPLTQTLVAYDDLDLSPGIARLKRGGSSGGHRGVADIARVAGGDDFLRLRVGIGHPRQQETPSPMDVTAWVLGRPAKSDREQIHIAIGAAVESVDKWLAEGFQSAQQRLHSISK